MKKFFKPTPGSGPPSSASTADDEDGSGLPIVDRIKKQNKRLADVRQAIKDLSQRCDAEVKSGQNFCADGRKFSATTSEARTTLGTQGTLAEALSTLSAFQRQQADVRGEMLDDLKASFSDSLMAFCRSDLDAARTAKEKRYDPTRKQYNAAEKNYQNLRAKGVDIMKIKEAEGERDSLKADFDRTAAETDANLQRVEQLGEILVIDNVCTYLESLYTYFETSLSNVEKVMVEVERIRNVAKHKRGAYEKTYDAESLERMTSNEAARRQQSLFSAAKSRMAKWKDEGGGGGGAAAPGMSVAASKGVVFGAPLSKLMGSDGGAVPALLRECVAYLTRNGIDKEGVFRLSGSAMQINELKKQYESGQTPNLDAVEDHNVVAGLMKLWLREMPEPLLTYNLYDDWIAAAANGDTAAMAKNATRMPKSNAIVLRYLCDFLRKVAARADVNKMAASNLSIVFSPNILYKRNQDPFDASDFQLVSTVVIKLIDEFEVVFANAPMPSSASGASGAVSPRGGRQKSGQFPPTLPTRAASGQFAPVGGGGGGATSASPALARKAAMKKSQPTPAPLSSSGGAASGGSAVARKAAICDKCGEAITGKGVATGKLKFHKECFVCAGDCGQVFSGRYYMKDGQPYCREDYEARFGPLPSSTTTPSPPKSSSSSSQPPPGARAVLPTGAGPFRKKATPAAGAQLPARTRAAPAAAPSPAPAAAAVDDDEEGYMIDDDEAAAPVAAAAAPVDAGDGYVDGDDDDSDDYVPPKPTRAAAKATNCVSCDRVLGGQAVHLPDGRGFCKPCANRQGVHA